MTCCVFLASWWVADRTSLHSYKLKEIQNLVLLFYTFCLGHLKVTFTFFDDMKKRKGEWWDPDVLSTKTVLFVSLGYFLLLLYICITDGSPFDGGAFNLK